MFPSFAAPTSLSLSHDRTANQNPSSNSFQYHPVTNDDDTNEYFFEDILDNYHSLIDQPSYQDSIPLDFAAHLSRSNEQAPVLQEMTTVGTRYNQDYSCLDFADYFRTNDQNMHFQETITAGPCFENTDNSIKISFMPRPNNFHMQVFC